MTTENPFEGREHGNLVFITRQYRCFYIGRLWAWQQKKWLRDHPELWKTREDALRDLQARAGVDVEGKPAEARSTKSANEVRTSGEADDKPATNIVPRTIANPQASTPATAAAGGEIVIDDRHRLSERRVAKMLGCSPRTLQRWRTKGKGPASTKIGRKVFYELNDLQEWMDRGKIR